MRKIKVDLGFGREEYLTVANDATIEDIKKECQKEFDAPLFKIVYSHCIESLPYNEY